MADDNSILVLEEFFRGVLISWRTAFDIDGDEELAKRGMREVERLPRPDARSDFDELCRAGCHPSVLALLIALVRNESSLSADWDKLADLLGRNRPTAALSNAATLLDAVFDHVLRMIRPDDELVAGAEPDGIVHAIARNPVGATDALFTAFGFPSPRRVASDLWIFDRLASEVSRLSGEIGSLTLEHLSKYLLATYVYSSTGRHYDRNVSGLIAAVQGRYSYDESAHRNWRHRNQKAVEDPNTSGDFRLFHLPVALSRVLKPRTEFFQ